MSLCQKKRPRNQLQDYDAAYPKVLVQNDEKPGDENHEHPAEDCLRVLDMDFHENIDKQYHGENKNDGKIEIINRVARIGESPLNNVCQWRLWCRRGNRGHFGRCGGGRRYGLRFGAPYCHKRISTRRRYDYRCLRCRFLRFYCRRGGCRRNRCHSSRHCRRLPEKFNYVHGGSTLKHALRRCHADV